MVTISKSPPQANPAIEAKREGLRYCKSLVRSGYAPVKRSSDVIQDPRHRIGRTGGHASPGFLVLNAREGRYR